MTKCGQSDINIVYNHNNEDYVITGAEKNVTCESRAYAIRSVDLISTSHNKVGLF